MMENNKANEYALRLLSIRAYTAKALREKLSLRTGPDAAQAAVGRMEEMGLVNDADYARRYAADCIKLKGYSLRRAAFALCEKGIDKPIIEQTLAELEFDAEPSIARVLERRYPHWQKDEKSGTKAVNALVRLGYNYGDIRTVMRNLEEDADYYEIEKD